MKSGERGLDLCISQLFDVENFKATEARLAAAGATLF
jgi:hypothetical protein